VHFGEQLDVLGSAFLLLPPGLTTDLRLAHPFQVPLLIPIFTKRFSESAWVPSKPLRLRAYVMNGDFVEGPHNPLSFAKQVSPCGILGFGHYLLRAVHNY